jgi:hypothetical protein
MKVRKMDFGEMAAHAHAAACQIAGRTDKVARSLAARMQMKPGKFAIPRERKFPIHDIYHAKLALSHLMRMIGRHGLHPNYKAEAKKVLAAVKRHWPSVYACEADLVKEIRKAYKL